MCFLIAVAIWWGPKVTLRQCRPSLCIKPTKIGRAVICYFLFIMEDIDCQSEQLIAPNKLQMFCMHSCSIYVFMCINFKKKAVKNVSVLALSLQSFICLQAVRCGFCIFFPSVFFYIFLSRRLSSGHESSQRLRCCSVLSLTVTFFFFFVSCSFEAYLHHC